MIIRAGDISLGYRQELGNLKISRKSPKDIVTEADYAVEEYIISQIKERYSDHEIVGEETGTHSGKEYRWVIDPIDGTSSFAHGQPFYTVSIAVEKEGLPVLAAVYAPVLGELYEATKGGGATLNGEPISVSNRDDLIDGIFATGFAAIRSDKPHTNLPYFNALIPIIRGVRRYGSAALDLCYVAAGRLDGFWELYLNLYDVAAGFLIVSEAGGMISDFEGRPLPLTLPAIQPSHPNDSPDNSDLLYHETVCTNGHVHTKLIEILSSTKAELLK